MVCNSYSSLNIVERVEFIGKAVHLLQSDETAFAVVEELIAKANREGVFTNVKFLIDDDGDD